MTLQPFAPEDDVVREQDFCGRQIESIEVE